MGAEVIESQDDWNYTRSILFGYAIPFYHTGVRATITASPKLVLGAQLVNGWNNTSETDGDKTFHFSATLKPNDKLTWIGNYMVGKETAGSDDVRNLFDTTLTVAATPKLSLMGNLDYGKEGGTTWWGIAGYAKYQATPTWALIGRYEYLDDTDGGFMTFGTKAQSLTVTSDHTIAGALKARLEYRTDFADEAIFAKDDGSMKKSQTTLTVGLVYAFGGGI
jgi:predicted porin